MEGRGSTNFSIERRGSDLCSAATRRAIAKLRKFQMVLSTATQTLGPSSIRLVKFSSRLRVILRRAVFSILEITEDTRRVLENDRYNRPRGLPKLEAYLHGTPNKRRQRRSISRGR